MIVDRHRGRIIVVALAVVVALTVVVFNSNVFRSYIGYVIVVDVALEPSSTVPR